MLLPRFFPFAFLSGSKRHLNGTEKIQNVIHRAKEMRIVVLIIPVPCHMSEVLFIASHPIFVGLRYTTKRMPAQPYSTAEMIKEFVGSK